MNSSKFRLVSLLLFLCLGSFTTHIKAQGNDQSDGTVAMTLDILGDTFSPGESLPARLFVGNNGDVATENAFVIVQVMNGTIPFVPSTSRGTTSRLSDSSFRLDLIPLDPGASFQLTFNTRVGDELGVEAFVILATITDPNDKNTGNNEASVLRNVEPGATNSSISGMKWRDINGNGVKDEGEPGLAGWRIFLDLNNDGIFDDGSQEDADGQAEPYVITPEDGTYQISELSAGTYIVREEIDQDNPDISEDWVQTFPNNPNFHTVELGVNANAQGVNFGNVTASASIRGMVWQDNDSNGMVNDGETPFSFPRIKLDGGFNNAISRIEDFADNDTHDREIPLEGGGFYSFDELTPGTYTISQELFDADMESGWDKTFPLGDDEVRTIQIIEGQTINDINFGVVKKRTIRATVINDANANRAFGNIDRPLEGIDVFLNGSEAMATTEDVQGSGVTAANTFAFFDDLLPKVYVVNIDVPEGRSLTIPSAEDGFACIANFSGNAMKRRRSIESFNTFSGVFTRVVADAECLFGLIDPSTVEVSTSVSDLATTITNISSGQSSQTKVILIDPSGASSEFIVNAPLPPLPPGLSIIAGLDIPGLGASKAQGTEPSEVVFDGSSCPEPCNGLTIAGDSSSVHGITIRNFPSNGIVVNGSTNSITETNISGNQGAGVVLESGSGNTIRGNAIFDNGGLGIDLGADGITENDTDDDDTGANGLLNFPIITSVTAGSTNIDGTFSSTPNSTFELDFYGNSRCNDSGNGEGQYYLGSTRVNTDSEGEATFSVSFEETFGIVSATATDSAGSTSEFSDCGEISDSSVLSRISIEPDSIRILPGSTFQFSARGFDIFNRDVSFATEWSATGGAVDANGMYTAGNETGLFQVTAVDPATQIQAQATIEIALTVSVEDDNGTIPGEYSLYQNYPNPFNPSTTISFDIPRSSDVQLIVYDLLGRQVASLASGNFPAGQHSVRFDASGLASGIYIYRLHAGSFVEMKKLLLIK